MKAWCKHDDGRFRHGDLPYRFCGDNRCGFANGRGRKAADEMAG